MCHGGRRKEQTQGPRCQGSDPGGGKRGPLQEKKKPSASGWPRAGAGAGATGVARPVY